MKTELLKNIRIINKNHVSILYLCKQNYVNITLRVTCSSICSYGKYIMTTKSAKNRCKFGIFTFIKFVM